MFMDEKQISPTRLRIGILLFAIFWLPLPVIVLGLAQDQNTGSTPHAASIAALLVGLVQTILGIIGFMVAGKETFKIVKNSTWKSLPGNVWAVLRHGTYDHP